MTTPLDPKYKLRLINKKEYVAFEAYDPALEDWKELFIRPTVEELTAMATTPVLDIEGKEQLDENGNIITCVSPFYYIP